MTNNEAIAWAEKEIDFSYSNAEALEKWEQVIRLAKLGAKFESEKRGLVLVTVLP